jgi:hypothetical protein
MGDDASQVWSDGHGCHAYIEKRDVYPYNVLKVVTSTMGEPEGPPLEMDQFIYDLDGVKMLRRDDSVFLFWVKPIQAGGDQPRHVMFSSSDDRGSTWTDPKPVDGFSPALYIYGVKPKVGAGGELYLAFGASELPYYGYHVSFVRSVDGGANWSSPLTLSHSDHVGLACFESNPGGELIVGWADNASRNLWCSVSTDQGETWFPEETRVAAAVTNEDVLYLSLAYKSGIWHAAYVRSKSFLYGMEWVRVEHCASRDGGHSFGPFHVVEQTDFPIAGGDAYVRLFGAGTGDLSEGLYLIWVKDLRGVVERRLMFSRYDDDVASFLTPVQVNQPRPTWYTLEPVPLVLQEGHLVIVWFESTYDRYMAQVLASASKDFGSTWEPQVPVSSVSQLPYGPISLSAVPSPDRDWIGVTWPFSQRLMFNDLRICP